MSILSYRVIITFVTFSLLSCAFESKQTFDEKVKLLQAAHNSKDIETELSLYSDSSKIEIINSWAVEGKAELRRLFELDTTLNSKMYFSNFNVHGDTVSCKLIYQNDWFKSAGIDCVYYDFNQFVFKEGLIGELKSEQTLQSKNEVSDTLKEIYEWAENNRSEEFAELKSKGLKKENAEGWLKLFKSWHEANLKISLKK